MHSPVQRACSYCRYPTGVSSSFKQANVSANHAFEPAVAGTDQQAPFGIEGLCPPFDDPFARLNAHIASERRAMSSPFLRQFFKTAAMELVVIDIQLAQDLHR